MKTVFFIFLYNNVDFIEIQIKMLLEYITEKFEIIYFDDSDEKYFLKTKNIIDKYLFITHLKIPDEIYEIHNPSYCYGKAVSWAWKNYYTFYDNIIIMHSDIFPLNNVSVTKILNNFDIVAFRDGHFEKYYICPSLVFINKNNLINPEELSFELTTIDESNTDSGGNSYFYLNKYNVKIKWIQFYTNNDIFTDKIKKYISLDYKICNKYKITYGWMHYNFYHYICGSHWNSPNYKQLRCSNINYYEKFAIIIFNWYKNIKKKIYFKGHMRRINLMKCLL